MNRLGTKDPLIEILAIKLYEHDCKSGRFPAQESYLNWYNLCDEDRDIYRKEATPDNYTDTLT